MGTRVTLAATAKPWFCHLTANPHIVHTNPAEFFATLQLQPACWSAVTGTAAVVVELATSSADGEQSEPTEIFAGAEQVQLPQSVIIGLGCVGQTAPCWVDVFVTSGAAAKKLGEKISANPHAAAILV